MEGRAEEISPGHGGGGARSAPEESSPEYGGGGARSAPEGGPLRPEEGPPRPEGGSRQGAVKPVVLILAVVGVVAVAAVMVFSGQQQLKQLQGQVTLNQQRVAELEGQNRGLNQQLESLLKERKTTDERLESLRKQLGDSTKDLEQSRKSLEALQQSYAQLTVENTQQLVELASVTSGRDEITQRVRGLEEEKANLQRSVSRLRSRLDWLDRDYRQVADKLAQLEREQGQVIAPALSQPPPALADPAVSATPSTSSSAVRPSASAMAGTVELPPIIVRKNQPGVAIPVRGRVLEANEQHQFIVIDRGGMDGVRVGMAFDLLHGGASVGRATVVRVRPKLSACDIVRASTPGPLTVGDVAVQATD